MVIVIINQYNNEVLRDKIKINKKSKIKTICSMIEKKYNLLTYDSIILYDDDVEFLKVEYRNILKNYNYINNFMVKFYKIEY